MDLEIGWGVLICALLGSFLYKELTWIRTRRTMEMTTKNHDGRKMKLESRGGYTAIPLAEMILTM